MAYTWTVSSECEKTLANARRIYGNKKQLAVVIEELGELTAELAKYFRYDDEQEAAKELHEKVLEETADAINVLCHVIAIFRLGEDEIATRIDKKDQRLKRWMLKSSSLQLSMYDRELGGEAPCDQCKCGQCEHYGDFTQLMQDGACLTCGKEFVNFKQR